MNKLNVMNNFLNIRPYAPNLGAIITNIDLSIDLSDAELKSIRDSFHKFQVLFFQNQYQGI